jgi:hypothetical protein
MTLGVTPHKIADLYPAHCVAGGIFACNQVDGLRLSPGILLRDDVLDVVNIYCHLSLP